MPLLAILGVVLLILGIINGSLLLIIIGLVLLLSGGGYSGYGYSRGRGWW